MTATRNADGTVTIVASEDEADNLWAACRIQELDGECRPKREALYKEMAEELGKVVTG